jgi:hypothetical protein
MSNLNSLLLKSTERLLADEPLIENKPRKLELIPNRYDWGQIYDHTHRKLSNDEILMYKNLCESYSDMSAYFLCKTFFTKNEVAHLMGQLEYFNCVKQYFFSPNSEWDAPTFLKLEIRRMEDELERYFAQFTTNEGGN